MRISWYCNDPKTHRSDRGECGAKTRKGTPCKASPVWCVEQDKPRNGRCKLHGGLSTGPKTAAGKEAIRVSNEKRAQRQGLSDSLQSAPPIESNFEKKTKF